MAGATPGWAADMPAKAATQPGVTAPNPQSVWTVTASSEVRYFSWKSNRGWPTQVPTAGGAGGSGWEIYIPFAAQLVGKTSNNFKFEFLARGGWVQARQNTPGLSGKVATSTDTVANATVSYLGIKGFQSFIATSFNIPTGRSSLPGTAANARMDPDLVDITNFREGFNVGPSAGFSVPITKTLVVNLSIVN